MPDLRLLLFIHTWYGLKLSARDLEVLLAEAFDPGSLEGVAKAFLSEAARAYLSDNPDWLLRAHEIWRQGIENGVNWCHLGDRNYPQKWHSLSQQPLLFTYRGDPAWCSRALVAVVGSRTPRAETSLWMQRELSRFLRRTGIGVVSGGARGVDQWSHRIALDCDQPTVVIFPSGILNPYPSGSEGIWKDVLARGGTLLSTFPLTAPMRKYCFSIRNRWIAGLGEFCFVAEANRRSGSLLTAKLAHEEGRTVCTLPVFPLSEQGLANLDLIFDGGAQPIRDHLDLCALIAGLRPTSFERTESE